MNATAATAAEIVEAILDAGFSPSRSDFVPAADVTPERRAVVGYTTKDGDYTAAGYWDWKRTRQVPVLGDVVDAGGVVLNAADIAAAEAVLADALTDARIYEDAHGYLRPVGWAALCCLEGTC